MKKGILILLTAILIIVLNSFANAGDFIVEGNVGIGTDTPQQKLDVRGSIQIPRDDWKGLFFGSDAPGAKGLIWRGAYGNIAFNSDSLIIGRDGNISELRWDTNMDGAWAYCEGLEGSATWVNCANYTGTMTSNDHYWVFKNGHGAAPATKRDLKLLFDGESNDGVMGYMEDEDAFYFNEKLGIGTATPTAKLQVAGGDAYTSTAGNGLIVKSPNGAICKRIGIDDSGTIVATSVSCP